MNFSLPSELIIQGFHLQTILLFLAVGIFSWFFSMWYEGRRDGFDEEKLLDLSFLMFITGSIVLYLLHMYTGWLAIYRPYHLLLKVDRTLLLIFGTFISSGLTSVYLCKFWSWSKYRILDIYVSSISQLGFFLSFGGYLIYKNQMFLPLMILLPLIYTLILRLRGLQFISGATFSIFVFLMSPYIALFYRALGYLFFCFSLATISIINFYLRWRKNYAGTTSFGGVYKTVKRKTLRKTTGTTRRDGSTKK